MKVYICTEKEVIPVIIDWEKKTITSLRKGTVQLLRKYGWEIDKLKRKTNPPAFACD